MQRFHFPLEAVLQYRRVQAEREEARLQELHRELQYWQFQIHQLESARDEARRSLRVLAPSGAIPLANGDRYQEHVRTKISQHSRQITGCRQRVEKQQAVVIEANRQYELLKKLKEKARAEWQIAVDRQEEELAAEVFLAAWPRG